MILTDEQKDILIQYVPNAQRLIDDDNICELELALDAQIVKVGMDDNFELNETGLKLQLLYDQIYNQNDNE